MSKPFNIDLFPLNMKKDIYFSPSSLKFLSKNNFDMNHVISEGVPYI